MADVFSTLKAFTGAIYVNDFNMYNRIYRVYIQADAPYRAHTDNLNLFFMKSSGGTMIPVNALGKTSFTTPAKVVSSIKKDIEAGSSLTI